MSTAIDSSGAVQPSGLPLVNQALEPAAVRNGSPATQKAYATALDFEQVLLGQLSQAMVSTTGMEGSGESGAGEESSAGEGGGEALAGMASGSNSQLASMLPQSLTEGVMSQGGLGLAAQLMAQLDPAAGATATAGGNASTGENVTAGGNATAPQAVAVSPAGGVSA